MMLKGKDTTMALDRETQISKTDLDEDARAAAAEDLAAIREDWGAIHSDWDQMRMDADFEF